MSGDANHAPASEDLITLETEQCARVPAKVRSGLTTSSRERSKSIADIGADRILGSVEVFPCQHYQSGRLTYSTVRATGHSRPIPNTGSARLE
jgi:hypothetical protein